MNGMFGTRSSKVLISHTDPKRGNVNTSQASMLEPLAVRWW